MSFESNTEQMTPSPALALRNLGLAPADLMGQINQMNRMRPDIIPLFAPPPPKAPSHDEPLPEFTKFSELPMELRLKIWGHASCIQRDINIWVKTLGNLKVKAERTSTWATSERFESHEFVSNTKPPVTLQVCRESRVVGLAHYRLTFGTSYQFSNLKISTMPQIYVNWYYDRICLLWPHLFGQYTSHTFQTFVKVCQENNLRYLALNVLRDQHWPYVDLTTSIHSLEKVMLFGSAVSEAFEYHRDLDASTIGFVDMKTLASEHPEYWIEMRNHSWAIRLEAPRRDLITFFELNMHRMKDDTVSAHRDESEPDRDFLKTWKPPRVVTGYITMDGCPERSGWDW